MSTIYDISEVIYYDADSIGMCINMRRDFSRK